MLEKLKSLPSQMKTFYEEEVKSLTLASIKDQVTDYMGALPDNLLSALPFASSDDVTRLEKKLNQMVRKLNKLKKELQELQPEG